MKNDYTIRPWLESDGLEELTGLLHQAYGALADQGMFYVASHQSVEVTMDRINKGCCLVARTEGGQLAGTITWYESDQTTGCVWYDRNDVGHFGQFAVHPEYQGRGLGLLLVKAVENLARQQGVVNLALDTSEHACELIGWYEKLGYVHVGEADWRPQVNYCSVILNKALGQ